MNFYDIYIILGNNEMKILIYFEKKIFLLIYIWNLMFIFYEVFFEDL